MGKLNVKNVNIDHEQANHQATEKARIVEMAKTYYLQKGAEINNDLSKIYETYKNIVEAGHKNCCFITFSKFKEYFKEGIEQAKKELIKE